MTRWRPARIDAARTGRPRLDGEATVAVVGGGLAGLAAAAVLAERGVAVTVLEREAVLGGRAGAWPDRLADGTAFSMERGFHAFFRQYYNLRALMRRVDPALACLQPLDDYPILAPDGERASFAALPKRAPWNVIELVRRSPWLGPTALARVGVRRAAAMLAYDGETTYARWDEASAEHYLDELHFPDRARRMLFEVFAHSFFNPEHDYSAAELLMQFHFYFMGNPEGLVFDVMRTPFSRGLLEPLGCWLEQRGVRLRTGCTVDRIEAAADTPRVITGEGEAIEADAVVLALAVPSLREVVARSEQLGTSEWRARIDALEVTRPFAVWRLWLDRPTASERHPFVGTAGLGPIDNVSLYHLFEDESRAWADRTGGAVVELHAYAVPEDTPEAELRDSLLGALHTLYPETRGARIVDERWLWGRDCPAFRPGSHERRPGVRTPDPRLMLAGDFVRLEFPSALMERAAASGVLAANAVLERWDVAGEPVWSVPTRGLLAPLPL